MAYTWQPGCTLSGADASPDFLDALGNVVDPDEWSDVTGVSGRYVELTPAPTKHVGNRSAVRLRWALRMMMCSGQSLSAIMIRGCSTWPLGLHPAPRPRVFPLT